MNETMPRLSLLSALAGLAGWVMTLSGCDANPGPRAIHETEIKPRMAGSGMPQDAVHGFASGQAPAAMPGEAPEIGFDAPEGWIFEPGTGMRLATFKIQDAEGGKEATLVALPSTEGGYEANVRRWAGQLGMDLPDARLQSFLAGKEAFSTVQGLAGALFDFSRLTEVPDSGKGSMLAAIIESGGTTLFVKLTGGAAFLQRNKEKFLALSKSIRMPGEEPRDPSLAGGGVSGSGDAVGGGGAGAPMVASAGAGFGGDRGGMGAGLSMQSNDPAFNRRPEGVSRLTWQTPPGWQSLEAGGMRTGSFAVTYGGKTADGSIVQLPGPAGGVENNVRRWMEQAGLAPWDDPTLQAFLKSQRRIRTRDGFEGILIDLASQLGGNLVQENSILAVLIEARDETIFVKLTGPRTVLLQNIEALAQLSASLAVAD